MGASHISNIPNIEVIKRMVPASMPSKIGGMIVTKNPGSTDKAIIMNVSQKAPKNPPKLLKPLNRSPNSTCSPRVAFNENIHIPPAIGPANNRGPIIKQPDIDTNNPPTINTPIATPIFFCKMAHPPFKASITLISAAPPSAEGSYSVGVAAVVSTSGGEMRRIIGIQSSVPDTLT